MIEEEQANPHHQSLPHSPTIHVQLLLPIYVLSPRVDSCTTRGEQNQYPKTGYQDFHIANTVIRISPNCIRISCFNLIIIFYNTFSSFSKRKLKNDEIYRIRIRIYQDFKPQKSRSGFRFSWSVSDPVSRKSNPISNLLLQNRIGYPDFRREKFGYWIRILLLATPSPQSSAMPFLSKDLKLTWT